MAGGVRGRAWGVARLAVANRFTMWVVFILVHLVLGYVNLTSSTNPFGDVRYVYSTWMDSAFEGGYWVGIDGPWVYPVLALVPMALAHAFGRLAFENTWLSLVFVLDAVALAVLTGWGRRGRNLAAGWWWVLFFCALGPIATGRIDAPSVAVALIGVLLLSAYPLAASIVITVATWIKVWPVALIVAAVVASRHRATVIASVLATSVGVVAIALAFGAGANVVSFVTAQTNRGLQIEAPIASVWLWRALAGLGSVYYDSTILTYQVHGDGVAIASAVMNPVLAVAAIVVALLGVRALRRGMPAEQLLPTLSLGFVTCLIVFNKVGSPQYISWLAVPVVLAFATPGLVHRDFRVPGVVVLVIAGLTQAIYPFFYHEVLTLNPVMLTVLSIRNLLLVALFCWTVAELWRARASRKGEEWRSTALVGGLSDAGRLA